MKSGFRVIAPDMRGVRCSGRPEEVAAYSPRHAIAELRRQDLPYFLLAPNRISMPHSRKLRVIFYKFLVQSTALNSPILPGFLQDASHEYH